MNNKSKNGIHIIKYSDNSYPRLLKHISHPPDVIYVKGKIDNSVKCIAIVGSRKPSPYGLKCASYFSNTLSRRGFIIVSGLARGIDTKAHISTLKCKGRTYAVLGSGISNIYPKENEELANEIENCGAMISEYPSFEKPNRWNFPARNRIISGICHAIILVEGKMGSGSIITAEHALDQGREVFCIPGNIFSENSKGVNSLINEGARLVNTPDEVAEYVNNLNY